MTANPQSSSFTAIFTAYSDAISVGVSAYENKSARLVLPFLPYPLLCDLLSTTTTHWKTEPTVLTITGDMTVVGDVHGHILDLFRIIARSGFPPHTRYLFLGDIVDRGEFSTEAAILILTLKVLWPSSVFVIRGNHEFREMWLSGGFGCEVASLYGGTDVLGQFESAFAFMPLAAVVNGRALCVHGGIGEHVRDVSALAKVKRPVCCFDSRVVRDAFWSDPCETTVGFEESPRGIGCLYGRRPLAAFLAKNKLALLVRGHEVVEEGCESQFNGQVATVFSASAYCNQRTNKSAVLVLNRSHPPHARLFPR
jgi:protein phosphatase